MWIADRWKEYKVLDTSDGEKLEDWGGYKLIRPDPQVLWSKEKKLSYWRRPNAHYHRSDKGGGSWEFFNLPETWDIHYDLDAPMSSGNAHELKTLALDRDAYGSKILLMDRDTHGAKATALDGHMRRMTFHLKPFAFKHTGVFPEQAVNWDFSYRMISERLNGVRSGGSRQVKVLNLFAYTGGATLAAALAGAHVTHVDASKGMVGWARENAASSGLSTAPIRWLVDDCTKFVEREIRRGNRYDVIIMDPPSYGRGPKGEIWKIEESIYPFICLCAELLSDEPLFMLINSYTTGLQAGVLTYMLELSMKGRFRGHAEASEIGLPVADGNLVLPEGASGRFIFER